MAGRFAVRQQLLRHDARFAGEVLVRPLGAAQMSSLVRKPALSIGVRANTVGSFELAAERHYSVSELASLWGLSDRTVRRMFENEPGVLCWGSSESRHKRGYKTLRIPETVMLRVHRQLRIAG
jgi:transcriptional regulator GlxA family with amidase domain